MSFEAVILAGGMGTRLKTITGDLPKPMTLFGGTPFLFYLMRQIEKKGCTRIVLALGYRAHYVIDMIKASKPVDCEVRFSVEEEPLGTGGAIKLACKYITNPYFFVLNGDTYSDFDFNEIIHFSTNKYSVITAVRVRDRKRYDLIDFDKFNNLINIGKKITTNNFHVSSGCYYLSKDLIANFNKSIFSLEAEFIAFNKEQFKVLLSDNDFIDFGTPDEYKRLCEIFEFLMKHK